MDKIPPPSVNARWYTAWCPSCKLPVQYQSQEGLKIKGVLCPQCCQIRAVASVLRVPLRGVLRANACRMGGK